MKNFGTKWLLALATILSVNGMFSSTVLAGEQQERSNRITNNTTPSGSAKSLEIPVLQSPPIETSVEAMAQVTSVSQLSDVQPTDWAFQALQSLVERYGCIVGYPDSTFRGDRALTRYEFAAGVNACLDRINELITSSTADLVTQEDLTSLQRLQEEFAAELAALRGRVDTLEAHAAELEANQFSTTTKLFGNAIFAVSDVFGEDGDNNQTVLQERVSLNLVSSFTGRDTLLLGIFAGNVPIGGVRDGVLSAGGGGFNLPGVEVDTNVGGIPLRAATTTAEGTLSSQFGANTDNGLLLAAIAYSFPAGKDLNIAVVNALAPFQIYAPTLNPYLDDKESGTGAISVFGEYNPIYTLNAGAGVILNYDISNSLKLTAGYLADGLRVGNPGPDAGLFNGGYGILGQLTWNVTKNFAIAGVYTNDYAPEGQFGFNYNALGVTGTAVVNSLAGQDISPGEGFGFDRSSVITNGYGVQFSWKVSPKFAVSGWFSTFYSRLIGEGDGNILTYALTFAFPDLGKEGNLLGLVVGAEPYLTNFDGGNPQPFEVDVPLHIEAFYRYQLFDRVSITPGIIWLTAPNQDNNNGSDVIATIRTTFQF